jgi:hypothetical protein
MTRLWRMLDGSPGRRCRSFVAASVRNVRSPAYVVRTLATRKPANSEVLFRTLSQPFGSKKACKGAKFALLRPILI